MQRLTFLLILLAFCAGAFAQPTIKTFGSGKYIIPEALTSEDIADTSASLTLPLASFFAGNDALSASSQPNVTQEATIGPCIEWASGENNHPAGTTFFIPDNLAAAHSIELLCRSTQEATTTSTTVDYEFLINGHALLDATAIDNASATLIQAATSGSTAILSLPISATESFTPGKAVTLRLWRAAGVDIFRVYAVRMRFSG
jgi:hypothetical protein